MKIRIQQLFTQSSKGRVLPPNALATPNSPRSCHRPPSSGPCRIQQASKRPRVTSPSSPASSKQAARRCGWLLAEESFRKWYLDEAIQAVKKSRKKHHPIFGRGECEKAKNTTYIGKRSKQFKRHYTLLCYSMFWGEYHPFLRLKFSTNQIRNRCLRGLQRQFQEGWALLWSKIPRGSAQLQGMSPQNIRENQMAWHGCE